MKNVAAGLIPPRDGEERDSGRRTTEGNDFIGSDLDVKGEAYPRSRPKATCREECTERTLLYRLPTRRSAACGSPTHAGARV